MVIKEGGHARTSPSVLIFEGNVLVFDDEGWTEMA